MSVCLAVSVLRFYGHSRSSFTYQLPSSQKINGSIKSTRANTANTNNEINSNLSVIFSCRCGVTHSRIDDLFICPPIIILDLFHLLAIPYSWGK